MVDRTDSIGALLFILLLTIPSVGLGQESRTCRDGSSPTANLGITSFACSGCAYRTDELTKTRDWNFDSEPRILGIEMGGPADGTLEEGDWIVSIDGNLITTVAGARRWSSLRPGERISLKVRREDGTRMVEMVVGARCRGDETEARESTGHDFPRSALRLPRLLPSGWLGIGLTCDCSVNTGGDFPSWTFNDAPRVGGVIPGSPASRAGIRDGDLLVAVDGLSLVTREGGEAFSRIEPGQRVRLTLYRDEVERTVDLIAVKRP